MNASYEGSRDVQRTFGPNINEHMRQADAVAEKTVLDVRSPENLPRAIFRAR